jgi:hypothetical protein
LKRLEFFGKEKLEGINDMLKQEAVTELILKPPPPLSKTQDTLTNTTPASKAIPVSTTQDTTKPKDLPAETKKQKKRKKKKKKKKKKNKN